MSTRNARLLKWYRKNKRPLPWRESCDPYLVLVSEIMLQQTKVKTMLPFFKRFIVRFPNIFSLAAATEDNVVANWSGLGYYRRARWLHRTAKIIVGKYSGRFPDDVTSWLELPGVGRYTAGAIVSIAFGKRAPILDGNIARVLSRWFVVRGDVRNGETNRELWKLAEEVLPYRSVSDFNQALMELGALICTPKKPACDNCPVKSDCKGRALNMVEILPEVVSTQIYEKSEMVVGIIERRGRFLMFSRENVGLMEGLWEFPIGECRKQEDPINAINRVGKEDYGLEFKVVDNIGTLSHSIMHRRITVHVYCVSGSVNVGSAGRNSRWVSSEQIKSGNDVAVSSLVHKVIVAAHSYKDTRH